MRKKFSVGRDELLASEELRNEEEDEDEERQQEEAAESLLYEEVQYSLCHIQYTFMYCLMCAALVLMDRPLFQAGVSCSIHTYV